MFPNISELIPIIHNILSFNINIYNTEKAQETKD